MTTETTQARHSEEMTMEQLRSADGLWAVQRFLGADFPAVLAEFDERSGGYRVSGLVDRDFQKLRRTRLIAALFSSFRFDREAISYRGVVPEFVSRRETLVFVSTDDGFRAYHYRS